MCQEQLASFNRRFALLSTTQTSSLPTSRRCAASSGLLMDSSWRQGATTTNCTFGLLTPTTLYSGAVAPLPRPLVYGCFAIRGAWPKLEGLIIFSIGSRVYTHVCMRQFCNRYLCLRFNEHTAAVKAISWSPHQNGLLASGGGTADRCIRFWNTQTASALNCVDTGSQVSVESTLFTRKSIPRGGAQLGRDGKGWVAGWLGVRGRGEGGAMGGRVVGEWAGGRWAGKGRRRGKSSVQVLMDAWVSGWLSGWMDGWVRG